MKPYRILIWGHGEEYNKSINAIKYQELLGRIQIVGITDRNALYTNLDGYQIIRMQEISKVIFDYIVVTAEKYFGEIYQIACEMGGGTRK